MNPADHETAGRLIAELVTMASVDPLRDTVNAECYLGRNRARAHEIGKQLNGLGGFDLMVFSCDAVRAYLIQLFGSEAGGLARGLELNWDGIGQWRG